MKWMEMVRVRSSAAGVKEIKEHLAGQRDTFRADKGLEAAVVLDHAQIEGDLGVVMVWNNDLRPEKTREGLLLARYFAQFGPVDHAVWTKFLDLGRAVSDAAANQAKDVGVQPEEKQ